MPVKEIEIFKETFTQENTVSITVTLSEHSQWAPAGQGGITRHIHILVEGPTKFSSKKKFRDKWDARNDIPENNIRSISEITFDGEKYIAQTNQGEKIFK